MKNHITINNITYYRYKTKRTHYFLSPYRNPDYQFFIISEDDTKVSTPLPFSINLLRMKESGII